MHSIEDTSVDILSRSQVRCLLFHWFIAFAAFTLAVRCLNPLLPAFRLSFPSFHPLPLSSRRKTQASPRTPPCLFQSATFRCSFLFHLLPSSAVTLLCFFRLAFFSTTAKSFNIYPPPIPLDTCFICTWASPAISARSRYSTKIVERRPAWFHHGFYRFSYRSPLDCYT